MQTARQLHLPCFHPSLYSWAYSSSCPQVVANLVAMVLLEIGCSTIVSKIAGAFQLVATCLVTASAGKDLLEERRKKLAIDFIFAGACVGQEVEEAQAARRAYPQLVHCQQLRILKTGHDLGKGLFGSVVCALQAGIGRPKNAALKFPREGGRFSLSVKQQSLVADLVKAASLPRCQQTPGGVGLCMEVRLRLCGTLRQAPPWTSAWQTFPP